MQLQETTRTKQKMIFVIPPENRETFKFQEDLGDIKQFITFPDPSVSFETLMTTAEVQKKKKRKKRKKNQEVADFG